MKCWSIFRLMFVSFIAVTIFYGCAFTNTSVPINYMGPQFIPSAFQTKPSKALQIGKVIDQRTIADPRMICNKQNDYGKTSGMYLAEKPVADILTEAFNYALVKSNYNVNREGIFEINGTLMDFNIEVLMGFWSGEIKSKLNMTYIPHFS